MSPYVLLDLASGTELALWQSHRTRAIAVLVSHRTRAIAVLSCVQIGIMGPALRAKLCSVMEEHMVRTANLYHLVDELRK